MIEQFLLSDIVVIFQTGYFNASHQPRKVVRSIVCMSLFIFHPIFFAI